jgi:cellulose synthase/poly-beta-1,6-N-acetylglucosamine synthase-like glycosyltransferase
MWVTLFGMVTPVSLTHFEKAASPMKVMLFGKVIFPVIPFGTLMILVLSLLYSMPSCELYAVLEALTFIAARLGQLSKVLSSPISVTPLPMFMLERFSHSKKAMCPILVTLPGMFMLVRLEQPEKVPLPMLVTPLPMVMLVRL